MSAITHTAADLEDYIRDRVQTVLVTHQPNTSKKLHIESNERWMEPVCGADGDWLDKPATMYPHYAICPDCVEQRFRTEVTDE